MVTHDHELLHELLTKLLTKEHLGVNVSRAMHQF